MNNNKRIRMILRGPNEAVTFLAVGMAEQGCWTLEAIAYECGLSIGQVFYRLSAFGIRLNETRHTSRTHVKRKLLKMVEPLTGEKVRDKADRIRYIRTRIRA